jgi:lipopolysaccharide transport system permease protein
MISSHEKRRYWDLLCYKVYVEIKTELSMSFLGILWWFIEPVIYLMAFYTIFAIGFKQSENDYVFFLLLGLISWKWFSASVLSSTKAIETHMNIIQQVYFPKLLLTITVLCSNTLKFFMVFLVFIFLFIITGHTFTKHLIALPLIFILQFLWTAAIAGLCSSITPLFPDIKLLVHHSMIILMFSSGIYFNISKLSEDIQILFYLNPMAVIIESYRDILINQQWPNWGYLSIVSISSLIVLLITVQVFNYFDRQYAKVFT